MKRVVISVTNDLVTDQRIDRIATSLHQHQYKVLLIGRILPESKPVQREYNIKRFKLLFRRTFLFYAEYNLRLFWYLLFVNVDIFLSNDTDTLLPNYFASRIRKKKLVFDAHEMFPETPELVNKPFVKHVWEKIEAFVFPKLANSYTVCQSIADIYKQKYGIHMEVIRNLSLCKHQEICPRLTFKDKKIILYQGSVNMGRGVEWVINAMPYLDDVVFCVLGTGDIYENLKSYVKKQKLEDKVVFYGKIPLEDLHAYTISADLGISLLENKGLNYYYSLPNRIFDFIHAEVPVLASDFPEIRNVVDAFDVGELISHYEPEYLAGVIQSTLLEWETKTDKHKIFLKAQTEFCWENEEKKLLQIFDNC